MDTATDANEGLDKTSNPHRHTARVRAVASSRSARAEVAAVQRRRLTESVHSLWFKPSVAVICSLTLGAVLSTVDVQPDSLLWPVVFHGDASDARQLLVVVTSTMITVTSLVFALTVMTLQIASTQFSPRLPRRFLRDGGTQLVLSGFVGTVCYSMAGLFTVGTGNSSVPRLSISVALAMAPMSVGLLVYYIGHITNAVRIDNIVRKGVTVQLVPLTGYYVVAGNEVAAVWSDDGSPLKPTTLGAITALIEIHPERRIEHDLGLGVRQLVDITNRAMSTGQNDPYTGAQAVHHLTSLLLDAAKRSFAT